MAFLFLSQNVHTGLCLVTNVQMVSLFEFLHIDCYLNSNWIISVLYYILNDGLQPNFIMKGPFLINYISNDLYYSNVNRVAICPVLGWRVTMSTYQHTCLSKIYICYIYIYIYIYIYLSWQLLEGLACNVHDNVNVFGLGGIDLLRCCCGRACTGTRYCQYIHNMLLWACKKYCCCTYNIHEITPISYPLI